MSFLKDLFKAKPGGTKLGNIFRGAISAIPIVGGAASRVLTGLQQQRVSVLQSRETSFANQPATLLSDGTYNITTPLNEVSVSAAKSPSPILEVLGDGIKYLGGKATEDMKVGADNKTLLVIGGGLAAIIIAILATKK